MPKGLAPGPESSQVTQMTLQEMVSVSSVKQPLFGLVIYQSLPKQGMFSGTFVSHCLAGDTTK